MVRADSWTALARGHVGSAPVREGSLVVVDLAVQGRRAGGPRRDPASAAKCRAVRLRRGSDAGRDPEGERYDAVQRAIRYNHVALGPRGWGRAGIRSRCAWTAQP